MYLHIGDNHSIPYQEIVAILNLDMLDENTSTNEMIQWAKLNQLDKGKNGDNIKKSKTVIITTDKVYFSTISALTLLERSKNQFF